MASKPGGMGLGGVGHGLRSAGHGPARAEGEQAAGGCAKIAGERQTTMATASEFLQALREIDRAAPSTEHNGMSLRTGWLDDLRALRASIRDWMAPIVEAGLATVTTQDFVTAEPHWGEYSAPGLAIVLTNQEPRRILVRPRGLFLTGAIDEGGARITGARGRVDLECSVKREIVLRFKDDKGDTRWSSFAGGVERELDEKVFFDLLARTADVRLR